MKKKLLIIGGATVVAAIAFRTLYKNLYLASQWDFYMGTFGLKSLRPLIVTQTIDFINKSNFKLTVRNIKIGVFSNDIKIGQIDRADEQTIGSKGVSKFTLEYALTPTLGNQAAKDAITKVASTYLQTKDLPVDFVGSLEVKTPFGFVTVPVRYSSTGKNLYKLWYDYMNG
jgi:LEA14-like dessication related protein